MDKGKEASGEGAHDVCHNPCTTCNKKGYLDNEEMCPACAGTGCIDKKYCASVGDSGM